MAMPADQVTVHLQEWFPCQAMTLTFGPVAGHDDGKTVFNPTDLPWRRLGDLDSLLIDARFEFSVLGVVVREIVNVLRGYRTRLGSRTAEELSVEGLAKSYL